VVGHSLGGLTIPFVPAGSRIFLAALLPAEDAYRRFVRPEFGRTVRGELGPSSWPGYPAARSSLCPELDEADAHWAYELRAQARLSPEPATVSGPRFWVVTRRDHVLDPAAQEAGAREILEVEPLYVESGHSPFLEPAGAHGPARVARLSTTRAARRSSSWSSRWASPRA
jgi:hypothetical protein